MQAMYGVWRRLQLRLPVARSTIVSRRSLQSGNPAGAPFATKEFYTQHDCTSMYATVNGFRIGHARSGVVEQIQDPNGLDYQYSQQSALVSGRLVQARLLGKRPAHHV